MTIEQTIILIILYISNCFDSMRDRIMPELYIKYSEWTPKQWNFHIFKWISMFSIWIFMSWKFFNGNYNIENIVIFVMFAIFCNISWKAIYLRK